MSWSIAQSPALQAPIALSNPSGVLAVVGQPGGPQGQVGKTPPQSVLALAGTQPVLSVGINSGGGAVSISGSVPQRWQGPLRIPATVASVLAGVAPSVASGVALGSPLGINVVQPAYYSPEQPFINLMKVADQGSALAHPWMTATNGAPGTDTSEEGYLPVDSDGYATSLTARPTPSGGQRFTQISVLLNNFSLAPGAPNFYPAGNYRLKFIGLGTVGVSRDGSVTLSNSTPNTYVSQTFAVTPSGNGLYVTISAITSGTDYPRDISLVYQPNAAAYDAGAIFNPDFLSALSKFKSVRFMDWLRSNDEFFGLTASGVVNAGATGLTLASAWSSPSQTRTAYFIDGEVRQASFTVGSTSVTWSGGLANTLSSTTWGSQNNFATFWVSCKESWATRSLPSNASWALPGGVPLEVCVALANALSANAHLNVPASASDTYIASFAALVLSGAGAASGYSALASFLTASYELSNEVWNGGFAQSNFAGAQGAAAWPTQPSGGGNYDWNRNWFGMRTAQMAGDLQTAYGAAFARCIPVLGAQVAGTDTATRSLAATYWTTGSGPPSSFPIKAIAVAPYWGGNPSAADCATMLAVATPLDDFFACLTSQTGTPANGSKVYTSVPVGGWLGQAEGWIGLYTALMPTFPGMNLIAYEGGQNFFATTSGTAPGWPALVTSAERDARMGAAYTTYLNYWKANVSGTVFNINHLWNDITGISASGAFGLAESLEQLVSGGTPPSKWAAAQNYLAGIALAAPTQVQLILQGQAKAQDAQNGVPTQPSFATIGWKSVVGATSYNIYRNTATSGTTPSYSFYASVSAAAGASAYSSYVTGQGTNPIQTAVNCAYLDTAATNIVTFNFTTPGKTGTGPNPSGVYFPNNAYTYKVSAVVSGVESALSADSIIVFFANGQEIMCDGFFNVNGTFNFGDTTCPAVSPLGNTKNALWALNSSGTIVNPFTGNGCTSQQLGINGYNFLNVAFYPKQTGSTMNFGVEIAGDFNLTPSVLHLSSYGPTPMPGNVWTIYKLPLSSVQFNTETSPNAQQTTFYKITWVTLRTGSNQPNEEYWMEQWMSVS